MPKSDKDEQLRQRNKDAVQRAALFWIGLANDRLSEINKQLLAVGFLLLPLSGSVVLADIVICECEKFLLGIGWIFLFISIISGLFQIWVDAIYFKNVSRDSSQREKIWSKSGIPIKDLNKKIEELPVPKVLSTHIPLIVQAVSLLLGLIFIMLMMYRILIFKS